MEINDNKSKGRAGLSLAIAYFGTNGYTISIPLNDTQWYDLIIEKNNKFYTVQCKFTGSKDKTISLRSTGGTNGTVYDTVINHPIDFLFCADNDLNLFVIPVQDLIDAGNINSIKLVLTHSKYANSNCFDTSKYIVKI